MALFVFSFLIINNCLNTLLGFENKNFLLDIKPSTNTAGQNVGFYKVDDTLNLTCKFRNESVLPNVILEWIFPNKTSTNHNWSIYRPDRNFIILVIKNLQENDSGIYKCRAAHNAVPFFNSESSVKISVKNKKKECTDVLFRCSAGVCISRRYTCDGYKDCPHGEDESPRHCGPGNPCENKLMCPENRCIPFTWCCEFNREPNCTTKVKHSCCTHVEKLTQDVQKDVGFQYEQQKFGEMGFLQTTVYTVIGCAMAFMFIVTIIVIAICRVHLRRTLLSRCPTANRNMILGRSRNFHGNHPNALSFYGLDVYLNRGGMNGGDLMSMNPLLVTYNINNGVQFVGRPVDPPPYCEVVTSPPKEGPPPPYASQEDLGDVRRWRKPESSEAFADVVCTEVASNEIGQNCPRHYRSEAAELDEETSTDGDRKRLKNSECSSETSGVSSQSIAGASKSVGESKNSSADFPVSNGVSTEVTCFSEIEKVAGGEPSGVALSVRRTVDSNSFEKKLKEKISDFSSHCRSKK